MEIMDLNKEDRYGIYDVPAILVDSSSSVFYASHIRLTFVEHPSNETMKARVAIVMTLEQAKATFSAILEAIEKQEEEEIEF